MVEKSQKKMAKMKKGENDPDGSDSDFSFGVRAEYKYTFAGVIVVYAGVI